MPDNVSLPGEGSVIATKENNGTQYQEMLLVEKDGFTPVNPATSELQQSILDELQGLDKIKLVKDDGVTPVNPATSELQQSIIDKLPDPNASQKIADASGLVINPATSEDISNKDIMIALKALILAIANPPTVDKTANQIRAQVTGAVNSTATIAANQDIRNVTGSLASLTNAVNIDSYQGRLLMVGQSTAAWALSVRILIT